MNDELVKFYLQHVFMRPASNYRVDLSFVINGMGYGIRVDPKDRFAWHGAISSLYNVFKHEGGIL